MKFLRSCFVVVLFLVMMGCSSSSVSVDSSVSTEKQTNYITVKKDYDNLIGIDVEKAIKIFEDAGFTNIKTMLDDSKSDMVSGTTTKITIDETSGFSKEDEYLPTDKVVIYYVDNTLVKVPDVWYNLVELHYQDVEQMFKNAGFTNVVTKAHEVDYDESKVFEGSVVNICIGENNVTFEKDDTFDPSIEVRIDYRVKPAGTTSESISNESLYHRVDDIQINVNFEYSHIDSDAIILGNDERCWITLEVSPSSVTEDDVIFDYDDTKLAVENIDRKQNGNSVDIVYQIKALQPGYSEIIICSYYDVNEYGENATCQILSVNGLNAQDGRVVYVTTTGEKYHYSSTCVQSGIKTTLYDALAYEYEPCSKCVK